MKRYRNDGSFALDYSDSGGPLVQPGQEFEHAIPPAQLASHLRAGIISYVSGDDDTPGEFVAHEAPKEDARELLAKLAPFRDDE